MPDIIFLYFLYAAATLMLAYRLIKLKKFSDLSSYSAILVISIIAFYLEHADIALLISGVIIFNAIIASYGKKLCYLFIFIGILYAAVSYTTGPEFVLQSLFLGMLSGSNLFETKKQKNEKKNELRRNAVQIVAGVFLISVFYILKSSIADAVLFWFVIIGSIFGNYALINKSGKVSKFINSFERSETTLGSGARWLAIGSLATASFLTGNAVLAVFSAIFIADSLSTLFGISVKTPKLPYNHNKSTGGTAVYFLTVLAISYAFIGPLAVLLAIVSSLFESQPYHIDDNFDVAILMVAVFILLKFFGIGVF